MDNEEYKRHYVIESFACRYFKVDPVVLRFGKVRVDESLANARFMTWRALHELTGLSWPSIGKRYRKDHSTVGYGIKKVTVSPELSNKYDEFMNSYYRHYSNITCG